MILDSLKDVVTKGLKTTFKESLLELMIKEGLIKTGDFVLSSGQKSNFYIDVKTMLTKHVILKSLSEYIIWQKYERDCNLIAGVELGAVPLSVAVSQMAKKDYLIVRKSEKDHGLKERIIGKFKKGDTVLLLEDVVSTGKSVLEAIDLLKSCGLLVKRVVTVVDRCMGGIERIEESGVEVIPIYSLTVKNPQRGKDNNGKKSTKDFHCFMFSGLTFNDR